MATDKKHIGVYLNPAVEQALTAFCEQKGLKSKKGTMFSAGVNAALAEFFGISDGDTSNILPEANNIPVNADNVLDRVSNIPSEVSNIPSEVSNIPVQSIGLEELPGKPIA